MQSVMILGRQSKLGLAELESLYGSPAVQPIGEHAAIVDVDPCLLAFDRLGGATKFCKLLTILETTNWKEIEKFLKQVSPGHAQAMPEGKMRLGLSAISLKVTPQQLNATALSLKKVIKAMGRSVRVIPNQSLELNAAQVMHNQLTGPTGWELVFIRDGDKTVVAQTVKVQDIAAYARRDRERPKRDTRVGMLPPKLAQIILNLAVGILPADQLASICDIPADREVPRPLLDQVALDPFCGTGVLLQEAALMGYHSYGSDIDSRMIDYARQNLAWLAQHEAMAPSCCRLETGDATNHRWQGKIDFVASETYLGRPFTERPTPEILNQTIAECNLIIKKFLKNIHAHLQPEARLCLAVPAWQIKPEQFKRLPLIDQITDLGYNQVSFEHLGSDDLIYYRDDQFVARQLIVITRK